MSELCLVKKQFHDETQYEIMKILYKNIPFLRYARFVVFVIFLTLSILSTKSLYESIIESGKFIMPQGWFVFVMLSILITGFIWMFSYLLTVAILLFLDRPISQKYIDNVIDKVQKSERLNNELKTDAEYKIEQLLSLSSEQSLQSQLTYSIIYQTYLYYLFKTS